MLACIAICFPSNTSTQWGKFHLFSNPLDMSSQSLDDFDGSKHIFSESTSQITPVVSFIIPPIKVGPIL